MGNAAAERRLTLFIGPTERVAMRLRSLFKQHRKSLEKSGVAAPEWNHVRLYAAVAKADEIGILRYRRGLDSPLVQKTLTAEFRALFDKELPKVSQEHIVLASAQLGGLLHDPDEMARLRGLLAPYFTDIRIVAHVEEQARALTQHYAYQVLEGRRGSLQDEIDLVGHPKWWDAACQKYTKNEPYFGLFNDVQHPAFWLDYSALLAQWEAGFSAGQVTLRPLDQARLNGAEGLQEIHDTLGIRGKVRPSDPARAFTPETAASLTRMRMMNDVLIRYAQVRQMIIPHDTWSLVHRNVRVAGPPLEAGALNAISAYFRKDNQTLIARFPDLADVMQPDKATSPWQEADPTRGFRATQYLAAFAHPLRRASTPIAEKEAEAAAAKQAEIKFETLLKSETDAKADKKTAERMLNRVKVNHQMILSSQFRPHNALGTVKEDEAAPAYTPVSPRNLPEGTSGNVIVGCMKNEAPYILEWIAYHRAIGVDNFLIYTNGCADSTDAILGRLMEMGIVEHRSNENWKGKSPQQHALNQSLKEPLIQNAEWIAHIDVDEYINVRTGNGTLDDFFACVPDATNVAMTWRLFGHNGVTQMQDSFVIDQFDHCAPKYCPKPHTVWGFKTMFRNIGAYAKISCHRPNKLDESFENRVKWVNGSGQDMTKDARDNGWRSSKSNVGYDLLQLNHYALRSAESFLIKRQRGRALHVDRSIGINYWIRMDWNDAHDITIKRNIPRLRAEYDRLLGDEKLSKAHTDGVEWHKAKAQELHATPEFRDLYARALDVKLNETERVAYALSLDMES